MWFITYYLLGIILIPGIIYAIITQNKVQSTFKTFSEINSETGLTAKDACERILQQSGITDVNVVKISGHLTDNYNPTNKTLSLSESVYNSTSIASIGVAAHEAGHAIQHAESYFPVKLRTAMVPITNFGSSLSLPLIMISLFSGLEALFIAGILLYSLSTFFQLVTLPVEFNASKRAINELRKSNTMSEEELNGVKKVLTAAALTYVAALLVSLMSLLRLLLMSRNRR